VKSGAEQAATRAQAEIERLQAKRDLQQAFADLGEKALELADRGELSHAELQSAIDRAHTAKAGLDAIGTEPEPASAEEPAVPAPTETPPAS
jgi:hypothetical protein